MSRIHGVHSKDVSDSTLVSKVKLAGFVVVVVATIAVAAIPILLVILR
jgi:hypothetical protein